MKRRTTGGQSSTKGTPSRSSRPLQGVEKSAAVTPPVTVPPVAPPVASPELTKAQKKAAELVMDDEAWRRGLTDDEASRRLDEAPKRSDAFLARAAQTGMLTADSAYAAVEEARRVLMQGVGGTGRR